MLSYWGSPRNTLWDKGLSPGCLLGRWSQETQVGEWEERQEMRADLGRVAESVTTVGKWSSLLLGMLEGRVGHTSESSHLNEEGAGVFTHRFPSAIGWGLLGGWGGCEGGIHFLVPQGATWASVDNKHLKSEKLLRQRKAGGSQSGLKWKGRTRGRQHLLQLSNKVS